MYRNGGRGGGGGRQVCQFFLQGRCRFGDGCKNEHPVGQGASQSQDSGSGNRFAALNNQGSSSSVSAQDASKPYGISADMIKDDLTEDRPVWPLSCYGPGKNAPVQLIEGDVEQSPEEMRVKHYIAVAKGNPQESAQLEAQIAAKINGQIQTILGNLNGAIKYVADGKDQHPNRLDMANGGASQQPAQQQQSAFGAPTTTTPASAFGQPSAFGASAAASAPSSSAFGQPSAFGASAASSAPSSGFGKPSGLGQQSAFGAPATTTAPSGFGQPSGLGQQQNAFGAPAAASAPSSGFGQPSAFGAPAAPSGFGQKSTFGAPAAPAPAPGFGQPSGMGQKSAFGAPATTSAPSGFGQPSAFGQKSAFGAPAAPTPSGFGQQSAFGAPAVAPASSSSGFGPSASSKDCELDAVYYEGELGAHVKGIYEKAAETGSFEGDMPEIPPVRDWVQY